MNNLLFAGLELMLVGMGTVFVFLTLLVFATGLMSRIVLRFAPAQVPAAAADDPSEEELVAISAAINAHRNRQS